MENAPLTWDETYGIVLLAHKLQTTLYKAFLLVPMCQLLWCRLS